ncbi:glycosyltransferase family 2 protein [Pedobacter frigiditerrae]|uniref:glycosyltransferase family 2 protein n=1 Tax=Pedobacter frigiditerrae TaxID=2530452 RepID=UPI00292EE93F|nr:glycosyltransferase family 2 protein [Pedobacter frigiditerrae]
MVSIIILNYNTFDLTCDCIRSIIKFTQCTYEIVLVDNGSMECDPEKFLSYFPKITLIKSKENLGFSKGNNLGIDNAIGDQILLLNSDTVLINEAIDLSVNRIKKDNKIGALSAQLIGKNGEIQQASYQFTSIFKLIVCTLKLHLIFSKLKPIIPPLEKEHFTKGLWGTFFLFPKSVLSIFPNNKLTETFFMYCEDAEWSYILVKAKYKLLYFPSAKIFHYGEGSSKIEDYKKKLNTLNNQYHLLYITKSRIYASAYFLITSVFYISSFNKELYKEAKTLAKISIKNLFFYKKISV